MRKFVAVLIVMAAAFALTTTAWADGSRQTSGSGKTHHGGTFGFNVKSDLSGELEFQSPDGTINVHCSAPAFYVDWSAKSGYPDTVFRFFDCRGADTVWVDAQDRGEPGTFDKVKIRVKTAGVIVAGDQGFIANGNVQILGG